MRPVAAAAGAHGMLRGRTDIPAVPCGEEGFVAKADSGQTEKTMKNSFPGN